MLERRRACALAAGVLPLSVVGSAGGAAVVFSRAGRRADIEDTRLVEFEACIDVSQSLS